MPWLWAVGPIATIVILWIVFATDRSKAKMLSVVQAWRSQHDGKLTIAKSVPREFLTPLEEAGAGDFVAHCQWISKTSYVSVFAANGNILSHHQTAVLKLPAIAPTMFVHPLPQLDGQKHSNTGVQFTKDPDFMKNYLVEGTEAKAIGKWLTQSIRQELLHYPTCFLRTKGNFATVSLYGDVSAESLEAVLKLAEQIWEAHGPQNSTASDAA